MIVLKTNWFYSQLVSEILTWFTFHFLKPGGGENASSLQLPVVISRCFDRNCCMHWRWMPKAHHMQSKKGCSGSSSFSILPISAVQKIKRIYVWRHLWIYGLWKVQWMRITLLWTSPGKQVPNLGVLNHQLIYLREKEDSTDGKPPIKWSSFLIPCWVVVGLRVSRGIKVADSARHLFHETIKPHTMRCFNIVLLFYLIQRQGHCTSSSSPWLFIALIIASIQPACPITSDNADEFRSVGFFRRGWKHLETISLGAQETDS